MGTNGARAETFITQAYPSGLDNNNGRLLRVPGHFKAAVGASFRAGQPVMLNTSNEVVLFDAAAGSNLLGVAKWSKTTTARSINIDEAITFGVSGASKTLKHANLAASSVVVRSATGGTGTVYADPGDYTINLTNGVITHSGGGSTIVATSPVYVSYAWSLTGEDLQFQGTNFWGSLDYVTIQDNRIAVIQAPAEIFTTEYDTDQAYTLTGATSNIYAASSGLFTSSSAGGAKLCGTCVQPPTASYPFLGIEFKGVVAAST